VSTRTGWRLLLEGAEGIGGLAALARALGFQEPEPLDARTRQALGMPDDIGDVSIAGGPGAARALLVVGAGDRGAREHAVRLAGGLAGRAPHLLWLACVAAPDRAEVAVAAWSVERRPPRLVALAVDRGRVLPSDVDTLAAVAATMPGADLLVHGRWLEILGREAISRRFFVALERLVERLADGAQGTGSYNDRREVALLNASRLLFLAFLERKGWLDGDAGFLARVFDDCMARGGGLHRRVLQPLFFGTLNTPPSRRAAAAKALGRIPFLNGGLFQRAAAERRARTLSSPDEDWGTFFDELLLRYRFTAREETHEWNESAIDPEMLGRAFESLMAAPERRRSGAYFTPYALVERVTGAAIESLVEAAGVDREVLRRASECVPLDPAGASALRAALGHARVLDPSCGSGAFLVHALERLTQLRRACGDARPASAVRRQVLTESVFGVDVNPTAVWLCELRLWLAVVIDHDATDPDRVPPLPNIDHNIRCGDALAGGDFTVVPRAAAAARLSPLRARYVRATGARKRTLGRALDALERGHLRAWLDASLDLVAAQRRSLLVAARGRDLFGARRGALAGERQTLSWLRRQSRELRHRRSMVGSGGALPFVFAAHFRDVAADGGFDLVIGNPPWVRLHRIASEARSRLRREFRVFREAAWEPGARDGRAAAGFAGQVDLAALFVERSAALLRPGGVLSLLVPVKLWRSLAGGGVRRLLRERCVTTVLEDWSEAPPQFDAAVYPALVAARRPGDRRSPSAEANGVALTVHRGALSVRWAATVDALALDDSPGAPWLSLPPDARVAFERIRENGVALVASGVGYPALGVKCGCNEAFLVRQTDRRGSRVSVVSGARTASLEAGIVRPVLRGETVRPWRAAVAAERIVFPCDPEGRPLRSLPADVRSWLLPWRGRLERRADARGKRAWWALFRTEGARSDRPRVVWADLGRVPQALVLPAGDRTVPLNSCYVLAARDDEDALTLAALLNSALAAAWLGALAEPARGGYRRFLAWTVARLPVPDDWARARELLAPLGERALRGESPSRTELLEAALDAYRLRLRTVAPLLGWMTR
jgi:hypothetical protein